jgi:hypothetical protein
MHVTLPPATIFYRVIGPGRRWHDVLAGKGSYFGSIHGGRYNRSRQRTVYAATDSLVAISEYAFYEAQRWQQLIGQTALAGQGTLVPFSTRQGTRPRLWCFRLNPPPTVIDVSHAMALATFHHPPHVLQNPCYRHYTPTQDLMDAVFHSPATPLGQKAMGVQAPSVRTQSAGAQPVQQAFILAPNQRLIPGTPVDSWDIDIEFLERGTNAPANANTAQVAWESPRFRLHPPRGGSGQPAPFPVGHWQLAHIKYT